MLEEITDKELESLDCPTYESQEKNWQLIIDQLTQTKIENLLSSIGYELTKWNFFDKSCGVINRIYILEARKAKNDTNDEQLILRICNPHKFWQTKRNTNEVAIINYLKENTAIPVPRILAYSTDASTSPIGCEFILMERLRGIILCDLTDVTENPNDLPQKIIDQMLDYFKQLRSIAPPNMSQNKIGCFGHDLRTVELIQDGCTVEPCETFLDFVDFQLKWCVKEMRKVAKYEDLGNELEKTRLELVKIVKENPDLDNLNFGDEMTVSHGDLNPSNILIDPISNDITGIIDWDFCSHGFDCVELDFFQNWFDADYQQEAMKQRINQLQIDQGGFKWLRPQNGKAVRNILFNLVIDANQLGFHCSTWFKSWENCNLGVRVHLNKYANKLSDYYLKTMPSLLIQLREFKKLNN